MAETTSSRAVKILKFNLNSKNSTVKNQSATMEQDINEALQELAKQGHKVINIAVSAFPGDSTGDYIIYSIIYE